MTSHARPLVFVIAFFYLQRVLRILVKKKKSGRNLTMPIIAEQMTR